MSLRFALLGCGSIGRRHLENARILGQTELLAFDPDPSARQRVANEMGLDCLTRIEDVWQQRPDVALITAPSHLHDELALAAAQRGCHLFIEKPLSHTLDGLDVLCAEVERRKLVTMVACNMRFHPGPATVKRRLDERAIGDVISMRLQTGSYLPRWRPWQDYRDSYSASREWGGATLDCIHELDLALWLGGPAQVAGAASVPARTIGLETEGVIEILLRHDSGALSSVHLNFVQRDNRRSCQIIGSEGTIDWDFHRRTVEWFDTDGERVESAREPENWQLNQMYLDELRHFFDAVRSGSRTINPIADGVATLRVALAARQQGAQP